MPSDGCNCLLVGGAGRHLRNGHWPLPGSPTHTDLKEAPWITPRRLLCVGAWKLKSYPNIHMRYLRFHAPFLNYLIEVVQEKGMKSQIPSYAYI